MGRQKGYTNNGVGPVLETNGVANPNQALLNLIAGAGITLTPDGLGGVTIDASTAMQIGNPVGGANPYSVLVTDATSDLSQVTPSADGFLFWNNTLNTYSFVPNAASMAIGAAIIGSTDNEVLYTGVGGILASDSGFTREAGNNFQTTIQQSNGTGINGALTGSGGAWTISTTDTGPAGNIGRLDVNSSFTRILGIFGTGETGVMSASGNENRSQWQNATTTITSTSVQDVNQSTIAFTSTLIDARLEATATRVRLQYDNGANLVSNAIFDANQYYIKWDNNAGTNSQVYGTLFGATNLWTNGTAQAYITAGAIGIIATHTDGVGLTSQATYNNSGFDATFSDANGYSSQDFGNGNQTYQRYVTPYQLYTDEAVTYNPGDTLTDQSTGATGDVISDDGNGLVLLGNVVGIFGAGDIVDDGLGNQATLTANGGIYAALHGVGQNVVPTDTRYAMFLNDTSTAGVDDRYEIAHPTRVNFRTPQLTNVSSGIRASFNFNNPTNSTVSHSFTNTDGGSSAALQFVLYNGVSQFIYGLVGSANSSYGGIFTPSTVRFENTHGDIAYITSDNTKFHHFLVGGVAVSDTKVTIADTGLYVGNGKTSAAPVNGNIFGTEGVGTDIPGGSLLINGGQGTGIGQGGYIFFQTARQAGSTGSGVNALNTMAVINENQFITTAGRSINVTPHGDSAYLAKITDELVAMSIATTRVVTLPSAGAVGVGATLTIKDANGGATGGQQITITPDGTDTIDLDASGYVINTQFGSITIGSDGISNWMITSKIV